VAEGYEGTITDLDKIHSTSTTLLAFEAMPAVHIDHTHSHDWFSRGNVRRNGPGQRYVYKAISSEVSVEQHHGQMANYLYLDGHVEAIMAKTIYDWCIYPEEDDPYNFVKPQQ
jgi:prepilin-type processing-associated H-X9-DG protein